MTDTILTDASIAQFKAANLPIGLESFEEIISDEDTSEIVYEERYKKPEWPGGASGVTILLGYDLGYATHDKVQHDLGGKISPAMLAACQSCVGIKGVAAHNQMLRVRDAIDLPFSLALDVFLNNDIPSWLATNDHLLPNMIKLSPNRRGVLLSLSYNRGASYNLQGDRYREMRQIKSDMANEKFNDISAQLRSMARLWPVGNGVHSRRYREANLWDKFPT
jgi:hypothetical protein